MKIYVDENIPYANEFFGDFGELIPFAGRDLSAKQVSDADVLLVRSITKVNEQLLASNDKIKFVGTATIGFDHIDQDYLKQRGIYFTNAPGCNAVSVGEYVLSAIMVLKERLALDLDNMTVGIVGAGNTGTRLTEKLDAIGIKYLLNDPLLENAGDLREFSSLEQVLACDIISLHVPLTNVAEHPTYHLLDANRLEQLSEDQILINACRGEVVDNQALLRLKQQNQGPHLVLDVWEGEPNLEKALIPFCQLTSAHIAGYSLEGKSRGTEMLYQALSNELGTVADKKLAMFLPKANFSKVTTQSNDKFEQLQKYIFSVYDTRRDDSIFREQLDLQGFDMLRKTYPVRREFSASDLSTTDSQWTEQLRALGFNI